jgi:dTMP kinase
VTSVPPSASTVETAAVTARPRGRFITLEGGEGTGKSTQAKRLVERLAQKGLQAHATREPGGTPGAERIRALLLDPDHGRFAPATESLLFYAARSEHLDRLIRPALARGEWVVCDRFSDSTRAYQGVLGAVPIAMIENLELMVVGRDRPDLTLILDLDAEMGLARAAARRGAAASDGFEKESIDFHRKLRQAFLDLARREAARCVVIDASQLLDAVSDAIWSAVMERLGPTGVRP